jgi:hypothetical protein
MRAEVRRGEARRGEARAGGCLGHAIEDVLLRRVLVEDPVERELEVAHLRSTKAGALLRSGGGRHACYGYTCSPSLAAHLDVPLLSRLALDLDLRAGLGTRAQPGVHADGSVVHAGRRRACQHVAQHGHGINSSRVPRRRPGAERATCEKITQQQLVPTRR